MIRPLTCLCMLMAGGAGLTLYQEKHRTALLDREITRTIHATEAAHERSGLLRAEWALLNEPGHLQELADRLLALHPMVPSQFVQMGDLAAHLPTAVPVTVAPAVAAPPPGPAPTEIPSAAPEVRPMPMFVDSTSLAAPHPAGRSDAHGDDRGRPAPAQHPAVVAFAVAAGPVSAAVSALVAATRPIHTARAESPREPRPEAPAASVRSGAIPYGGLQAGSYGTGRLMAPVMAAVATPVSQQAVTAPVLARTATALAVGGHVAAGASYVQSYGAPTYGARPSGSQPYRAQAAAAQSGQTSPFGSRFAGQSSSSPTGALVQTSYSGSSLGTGRASLPPPVPMGSGAQ